MGEDLLPPRHHPGRCRPWASHATLYEWVDDLAKTGAVETISVEHRRGKHRSIHTDRFVNEVPLRGGDDALKANVVEIAAAGRTHWKIENENSNILKTKEYHLEHNFGHGKGELSALLVTLNLLAYLFHTVLELCDPRCQAIRQARGRRMTFFEDVRSLTLYMYFDG